MSVSVPSSSSSASQRLADEIVRLVQSRTGGRIHALNVEISDGEVLISGRTSTYYVKQLATHAALDFVAQFTALTNDVVVC